MLLLVAAGLTRLAALAQLGLLPLSVDRVDGAARAMMLSATEKNIKDTARIFFIDFGLVEVDEPRWRQLPCQHLFA